MSRYPRTVLGTVCLPWADDETLDEAMFRRTIANLVRAGLPDLYVFGTVERISPEAPVPVVRVTRQEERIGAAANVAYNIVTLGAQAAWRFGQRNAP